MKVDGESLGQIGIMFVVAVIAIAIVFRFGTARKYIAGQA